MLAAALATTATMAVAAGDAGPAAADAPRSGTRALGPVATDGDRLVAWEASPGLLRVASEGSKAASTDHAMPAACADGFSESIAGGGRLALLCWDDARIRSRLALLDLTTGSWRELPDPDGWRERLGGGGELVALGTRWLHTLTDAGSVLIDLRDGTPLSSDEPAFGTNLDAERPSTPACASFPHLPIVSDPPYAVAAAGGQWIALWECDSRRIVRLAQYAEQTQLGGGIVSWGSMDDAGARAYVARCRLTFAWPGWSFTGIAHTRAALYTVLDGRLRRLPLPRRCPRPAVLRVRPNGARTWRRVPAQLWPTGAGDAPLALRPPGESATVPVVRQPRGRLELRLPFPATQVTWRIGTRRWTGTMQGTDRRRWRIPGPRRHGLTRIAIAARDDRALVAQRYLLAIRRR